MTDEPRIPSNADIRTAYSAAKRLGEEFHYYDKSEVHRLSPGTRPDGKPMGWDFFSNMDKMVWNRAQQREREGRYSPWLTSFPALHRP